MPSRPLLVPLVMMTSSSFRMGMLRTYRHYCIRSIAANMPEVAAKIIVWLPLNRRRLTRLTLCFSRNSLLSGALMMVLLVLEGAPKWALRDFRREDASTRITCQLQLPPGLTISLTPRPCKMFCHLYRSAGISWSAVCCNCRR